MLDILIIDHANNSLAFWYQQLQLLDQVELNQVKKQIQATNK